MDRTNQRIDLVRIVICETRLAIIPSEPADETVERRPSVGEERRRFLIEMRVKVSGETNDLIKLEVGLSDRERCS